MRTQRFVRRLAFTAALALTAGAAWWGGQVTMANQVETVAEAPSMVTATVQYASVGRTLTFMATATQPLAPVAINSVPGIVTSVQDSASTYSGDVLFSVAGQPVFAVQGDTPFFRDMGPGLNGEDIRQLQEALTHWGFPVEASGSFGPATTAAVRNWQAATGQARTGLVPLGSLLALPQLPAAIHLGSAITAAQQLSGGENAIYVSAGQPEFSLVLMAEQAGLIPDGAAVDIRASDQVVWPAIASQRSVDAHGHTTITLTAPDGGLVCADSCDLLGGAERSTFVATVFVIPATTGPALPVAAVHTSADGTTFVRLTDGQQIDVRVISSGDGLAIVEGLDLGQEVVLFGHEASALQNSDPQDDALQDHLDPADAADANATADADAHADA